MDFHGLAGQNVKRAVAGCGDLIIEVWMPFNKSRVHRGMLDLSFQAGLPGWIPDPSSIT